MVFTIGDGIDYVLVPMADLGVNYAVSRATPVVSRGIGHAYEYCHGKYCDVAQKYRSYINQRDANKKRISDQIEANKMRSRASLKKNRPAKKASSPKKSPRKSPRNSPGKSPRSSPRKSLRNSPGPRARAIAASRKTARHVDYSVTRPFSAKRPVSK